MVAGWEKRLRNASFRGVAFSVLDYSTSGGRRVALHEYPFQDENYPEDMGQVSGKYRIAAFLLGDDHDLRADTLEAALLKEGKGELVHPRHGTLDVQLMTYDRSESTENGGMTKFSLEFVKAFKPRFPTAQVNVQAQVLSLQSQIQQSLQDQAKAAVEQQNAVRSDGYWLVYQLLQLQQQLLTRISGESLLANVLGSIVGSAIFTSLDGLFKTIDATVDALRFLPKMFDDVTSGGWLVQAKQLDAEALPALAAIAGNEASVVLGMVSDLPNVAADFIPALAASVLVTQVASAAALVKYESYDAAMSARDNAHQLLDAAQAVLPVLNAGEVSPVIYEQWRALRALIAEAIKQQALTLPRVAHVDVAYSRSALDIAYQLHEDGQQADNLLQRNAVVHPLFVSGRLEYLHG